MSEKTARPIDHGRRHNIRDAILGHQPSLANLVADVEFDTETLHEGEILNALFDKNTQIPLVVSGCLKQSLVDSSGDEHVTDFYLAGDVLTSGPKSNTGMFSSMIACDTVLVASFEISMADDANYCERQRLLTDAMRVQCARARTLAFYVTTKSAATRLAWFLLSLLERQAFLTIVDKRVLQLPMPRADIARHLGLAPETVSREFSNLSKQGMLEVDNRTVTVSDLGKLQRCAGHPSLEELAA